MNYIKKTIMLLAAALLLVPTLKAQNSIDMNRMQRDIKIMESILQEFFKTQWEDQNTRVHIASSGSFFSRGKDIRGTYLPDYGVIFTIPGDSPGFIAYSSKENGGSYSYSFRYSDNESTDSQVNEENVTKRIKEFLRDYGSTLGQLSGDDRIMIIYNSPSRVSDFAFSVGSQDKTNKPNLPTISVVTTKSDLQAYRSGSIDEAELNNRITTSTAQENEKGRLDLKVMGNIFETALKEQEDKAFRIRGSVNHIYLDNFGALFFFDVRYTSPSGSFIIRMPEIAGMDFNDDDQRAQIEVESVLQERLKESSKKQKETEEEVTKRFDEFMANLKEYLVDYGQTLSSVRSGQYVLLSATVSSPVEEIPERVDLQIEKSVLESADRGNISREEAMNRIVVREY
ncbi:hypothetical protein G3570_13825 [Balneolaceae bacterium YR4-1]|uniref:Uncharacterized protein n=1 Tax=Halalkalibaculum roseum TaxID=2709311 RepID=A0A6M1SQP9_9BACT|nr:hypothetical protein [Halalkalibaculum roseum]NGP77721.1 hypothetical protein [Halalkalibaculum roseum]